ncbi:MAG: NADH-quinone oxidoreductase subunit J [Cyclobacteriaceae bacterium]
MSEVLMYIFSGITAIAATFMLFTRNIMYAVIGLIAVLMALAGIYVLQAAEFVAVSQLMIYIGGVIVLLLFAVMLTQRIGGRVLLTGITQRFIGPLAVALLFLLLLPLLRKIPVQAINEAPDSPVQALGVKLLTDQLIPMEIVALLLLVVLIGAASIAGHFYITKRSDR